MNSLLRSLLTDHLDPGYAAAKKPSSGMWLIVGGVLVGLVLGIAIAQSAKWSGGPADRDAILAKVRETEQRNDSLSGQRNSLATQTDSARGLALAGNAEGAVVLEQIDRMQAAAATDAVHGPGLVVTLSDGGSGGRSTVLDRDVRAVVNALWASGAESVAVNDVRVGPSVTVRQAGGALLADNAPVFSPYRIEAIGSPGKLHTGFIVSDAYLRMSGINQLYGVGFDIAESDRLELPAANVHELRSAQEAGR